MAPPKSSDKQPPPAAAATAAAAAAAPKHAFTRPKCDYGITSFQDCLRAVRPSCLAWNCSGDQLAIGYLDLIAIFPVTSQVGSATMLHHRFDWLEILWRPGSDKQMAVLTEDKVILYELRGKGATPAIKWEASLPGLQTGAWSPEGKTLVAVMANGDLVALAGDSKRTLHRLANKNPDPQHTYNCITFRADGMVLAGCFPRGDTEFFKYSDAAGFSVAGKMPAHNGACTALAHSPDGKLLASASMDASMMVWRAGPYLQLAADLSSDLPVTNLSWSADSRLVAYTSEDKAQGVYIVDTRGAGGDSSIAFLPSCKLPQDQGLGFQGPMAFNPVKERVMAAVYCDTRTERQQEYLKQYPMGVLECWRVQVLQLGQASEQGSRRK